MKKSAQALLVMLLGLVIAIVLYQYILQQKYEKRPLPTNLHPRVEEASNALIADAAEIGIDITITDGYRSHQEQESLYEQGRSTEGSIVTNARGGDSYHNYGLAIDFALQPSANEVIWDLNYDGNGNGKSDWLEVVELAKALGFSWGGDWENFKDYPHLQMDFGLTLRELKRGKRPRDVLEEE
ncbi:M15 family metallopeptidase [Saliterribacillus persicus]|uniref:Peptidoglycan L-alanyl-D-glutamate endopeptidase CwlK n=1 Tax=Saliterribacillus persicus TaxID=930114 RepID=A0A368XYQ5_9BACI|nr:M15 family metallopeptidase [Saliterribacillus persicus]RCW73131.1 peptidoglycan L-alanyl-D-glutamate endopeptidase CwlK [Saliterribacillus persicus]